MLGLRRIIAGLNVAKVGSIRVAENSGLRWVRSGERGGSRWHQYELHWEDYAPSER